MKLKFKSGVILTTFCTFLRFLEVDLIFFRKLTKNVIEMATAAASASGSHQLMESTLMSISINVTDLENDQEAPRLQLTEMECPNCRVSFHSHQVSERVI